MLSLELPINPLLWLAWLAVLSPLAISFFSRRITGLPPSPPADPIIGHVRLIPFDYQWKTFASWRKKYGDIIHANVLGRQMVIINSFNAARDIMSQSIHSGRPRLIPQEFMGWTKTLVLLPYGDRWRKQRRLTLKFLGSEALRSFREVFQDELIIFHKGVWESPDELPDHINRLVAGTTAMVTYGHQVKDKHDSIISQIEHASTLSVTLGSPGATIVDLFPILRYVPSWIPGIRFKKHMVEGKRSLEEAFTVPYQKVQRERSLGTAKPSFMKGLQDDYERTGVKDSEHEEDMRALGGMVFSAGSETSSSVLSTFFIVMTLHPEIAKRAQEEIDKVLGFADRLPTLDDRDDLPYIDCILKELYRLNPPAPLGVPHHSMEPDTYNGYTIPKGSMLVPNIWLMMRDEKIFPEPEEFRPERYLSQSSDKQKVVDEANPARIVFGFGKRICPGRFLADQVIWMTIANVLALCDILPEINTKTGSLVLPALEFTSGVTSQPKPYKCRIVPRSKKHEALVNEML